MFSPVGRLIGRGIGAAIGGLGRAAGAIGGWAGRTWNGFINGAGGRWNPLNYTADLSNAYMTLVPAFKYAGPLALRGSGTLAIYYGNRNGKIVYVGRSMNIKTRAYAHRNGFDVEGVLKLDNLTLNQARAIEDYLLRHHGMTTKGGVLLNGRFEISSKHSFHQAWNDWAETELLRRGVQL